MLNLYEIITKYKLLLIAVLSIAWMIASGQGYASDNMHDRIASEARYEETAEYGPTWVMPSLNPDHQDNNIENVQKKNDLENYKKPGAENPLSEAGDTEKELPLQMKNSQTDQAGKASNRASLLIDDPNFINADAADGAYTAAIAGGQHKIIDISASGDGTKKLDIWHENGKAYFILLDAKGNPMGDGQYEFVSDDPSQKSYISNIVKLGNGKFSVTLTSYSYVINDDSYTYDSTDSVRVYDASTNSVGNPASKEDYHNYSYCDFNTGKYTAVHNNITSLKSIDYRGPNGGQAPDGRRKGKKSKFKIQPSSPRPAPADDRFGVGFRDR